MEVLFSLLAERYERGSVMLSSDLAFSGREAIIKDAMTTAAAIDRLIHHCAIPEQNVRAQLPCEAGQEGPPHDNHNMIKIRRWVREEQSSSARKNR